MASKTIYPVGINIVANLDYGAKPGGLRALYEKAKDSQWNAKTVVDWSGDLDFENPLGLPLTSFPMATSDWFKDLDANARRDIVRHYQGWLVSQFLHGEQFGVLSASRIAIEAPDHDSKFFATTQALDEARHLETYLMLGDKVGHHYGLSAPFGKFLGEVISSRHIDMVYLGLQIIGEGIGLASFSQLRRHSTDARIKSIYAHIMEDEARHVAFGRLFLRPIYTAMSASERKVREEFLIESCELMNERFCAIEVWEKFGLGRKDALPLLKKSPSFRIYKRSLFKQIVPVVKDIGLWSDAIQRFFASLGVADLTSNIDHDTEEALYL